MMPLAPGAIVDHDLLAEALGQLGTDQPADEIGAAARRESDNQADRPLRIVLRLRRRGPRRDIAGKRAAITADYEPEACHDLLSRS